MPIGGNFDSEKRQLGDWKYELGSKDKAKAAVVEPIVRAVVVAVRNPTALRDVVPAAAPQNTKTTL